MNLAARLWKNADWELRFPLFIRTGDALDRVIAPSRIRVFLRVLVLLIGKVLPERKLRQAVLTFDDGPFDGFTAPLLAALARAGVPATFFMVGNDAAANADSVRAVAAAGMEIAAHSRSHPRLPTITPQEQRVEIDGGREIIETIAGCKVTFFRPPHGAFDRTTLEIARDSEQVVALWNINPADYTDISAETIIKRVVEQRRNPAVILLHADRPATVAAIPEIVRWYQAAGYTFTTVRGLFESGQA